MSPPPPPPVGGDEVGAAFPSVKGKEKEVAKGTGETQSDEDGDSEDATFPKQMRMTCPHSTGELIPCFPSISLTRDFN